MFIISARSCGVLAIAAWPGVVPNVVACMLYKPGWVKPPSMSVTMTMGAKLAGEKSTDTWFSPFLDPARLDVVTFPIMIISAFVSETTTEIFFRSLFVADHERFPRAQICHAKDLAHVHPFFHRRDSGPTQSGLPLEQ